MIVNTVAFFRMCDFIEEKGTPTHVDGYEDGADFVEIDTIQRVSMEGFSGWYFLVSEVRQPDSKAVSPISLLLFELHSTESLDLLSRTLVGELIEISRTGEIEVIDSISGKRVTQCLVPLVVEFVYKPNYKPPIIFVTSRVCVPRTQDVATLPDFFRKWQLVVNRVQGVSTMDAFDSSQSGSQQGTGAGSQQGTSAGSQQGTGLAETLTPAKVVENAARVLESMQQFNELESAISTLINLAKTLSLTFWEKFLGMELTEQEEAFLNEGWAAIAETGAEKGLEIAEEKFGCYREVIQQDVIREREKRGE